MRHFGLIFLFLTLAACPIFGQAVNHGAASLVVNENDQGSFPLQSLLGRLDPGVLKVEGLANSDFAVLYGTHHPGNVVPGLGTMHIRFDLPWGFLPGQLDASGRRDLTLPAGSLNAFPAGTLATVQTLSADPTAMFGYAVSGATELEVVITMSAPLLLTPGENSVARVRGGLMNATPTSVEIAGVFLEVTAATQFENFMTLSQLAPGDWIIAQGHYDTMGNIVADELCLEDSEPFARVKGRVQGVGPSGFSVLGVAIYTNNDTVYTDFLAPMTPVGIADIEIGMMVELTSEVGTSFPNAASVDLNSPIEVEPEPEAEPEPEPETEIEFEIPPSFCS